jgi:hypothetical protein
MGNSKHMAVVDDDELFLCDLSVIHEALDAFGGTWLNASSTLLDEGDSKDVGLCWFFRINSRS